jgi:signal transduction histidine kinase
MFTRTLPPWAWPLAGFVMAVGGGAWLVAAEVATQRASFDTDARIAHRLLSQQAVQHDAMLAMLVLLQPAGGDAGAGPEQRLPALVPQVLQVLRRGPGLAWPADWTAAEAESAQAQRAVLAASNLAQGQYTLLRAGQPAAYALRIDATRVVPWAEWPLPREGPTVAWLQRGEQRWWIQSGGGTREASAAPWTFSASKLLAADSQPFELVVQRQLSWADLPWGRVGLWCVASGLAVVALAGWQRQRDAARRAQELVRLGQVGRLNALGELAAGMAHELNQPLTAVLAGTQAAQRLLDDAEPDLTTARQALAHSAQQARRAADVVARLRRLVQAPDSEQALQMLPLAAAVQQVLYLLAPQIETQGVGVDLTGLPPALQVQAEPVALEQIIHNLVLNALQAMEAVPAGARRLVFTAGEDGANVQLVVRDSGPGFAEAALPRAFEPFFTTRPGGLGLGLSLCETLAAKLGGSVQARAAPGGGAELVLRLLPGQTA